MKTTVILRNAHKVKRYCPDCDVAVIVVRYLDNGTETTLCTGCFRVLEQREAE